MANLKYDYPYVSDRYKSIFIDTLVLLAMMMIFSLVLDSLGDVPDNVRMALLIVLFLYEPVAVALGGTVGNYAMKIRVRKASDPSKKINIFISFIRYAIKLLLGIFSLLSVHGNPERKAIHDFVSGSVMVRKDMVEEEETTIAEQPAEGDIS